MPKFKKIELSVSELNEIINYCPDTGIFRWVKTRRGTPAGSIAGSRHAKGYITIRILGIPYLAHRLAWYIMTGEQPDQIDHEKGIKDDNRFASLRAATANQNQHNKGLNKNNTSGVKGVSWNKDKKAWDARVWLNGRQNRLGRFKRIADAELAVRAFRESNHKEFCNHGDVK